MTKSDAHHGFRRILIGDGHGPNIPILDLVDKGTILECHALCEALIWPGLARDEMRSQRESGRGGIPHGGELETSVYLHLAPDNVRMDKAVKEIGMPELAFAGWT